MEALAVTYIIFGLFLISVKAVQFSIKNINHNKLPEKLKTTFTPNLNIRTLVNPNILKQVFES